MTIHLRTLAFGLVTCGALLLTGCTAMSSDDANGFSQKIIANEASVVPANQIRCIVLQTAARGIIVTNDRLIVGYLNGAFIQPEFELPLARAVSNAVTDRAIGYQAKPYVGVAVTFDTPVAKNKYQTGANEISFDVLNALMVNNGQITESYVCPTFGQLGYEPAAQAVNALISGLRTTQPVAQASSARSDIEAKLKQLKDLFDKGLIDKASYDTKSAELLRQL